MSSRVCIGRSPTLWLMNGDRLPCVLPGSGESGAILAATENSPARCDRGMANSLTPDASGRQPWLQWPDINGRTFDEESSP